MDRVGVSFKSPLKAEEIRARYIEPLRSALESDHAGFYSNYLRQADANDQAPAEHLLVFQVRDFQTGLRRLRTTLETLDPPEGLAFHNLDPSEPMY